MSDLLLPHVSVLTFEGPDALRFCQSQLMNDVNALQLGDSQWSGWLSPKGRVIALGRLHRSGEQRLDWLLMDHPATALQPLIAKFVMRSKLIIRATDSPAVLGLWQALPTDIPMGDGRGLRLLTSSENASPSAQEGLDAWMAADLSLGLPRLPWPDGVEAYTPHMLSLERLNAFSTKKGCYPGQEIVARTHFLGASKRQLIHVQGQDLSIGDALHDTTDGTPEIGKLIRATADGRHGQAVVSGEPSGVLHRGVPLRWSTKVKNAGSA